MIKRVVYLVEIPFTKRDYERRGIDKVRANGFDVEVWDCTPLVYPHLVDNENYPQHSFDGLTVFYDKKILLEKITELGADDFIISLLFFHVHDLWIFRAISRTGASYGVICASSDPRPTRKASKLIYYYKRLFPLSAERIGTILLRRLPFKWFGIKPVRFVFAGSRNSLASSKHPIDGTTEVVWAHDLDYDLFLQHGQQAVSDDRNTPYMVYIDQYLPYHDDLKLCYGLDKFIDPERYYSSLESFFEFMTEQTGMEVVIAAHPASDYEKHNQHFRGYRIFKYKTIDLIKGSKLVIVKDSTARNYAVLYGKPILFITTDGLEATFYKYGIEGVAGHFGKAPLNIDKFDKALRLDELFRIDQEIYRQYKETFIKTAHSPDLPFWDIVCDRIKSL